MRKLLVLLLVFAMTAYCALAQEQWTGAVLVGNFPEDARIIETESSADGFIETMLVLDGYIAITLARFPDEQARAEYLKAFHPEMEPEIIENDAPVAGCEALHTRYMAVKDGDLGLADSYCFETETDIFLFHVFANDTDWDDYEFFYAADYNHFLDMLDQWVQSLEIENHDPQVME